MTSLPPLRSRHYVPHVCPFPLTPFLVRIYDFPVWSIKKSSGGNSDIIVEGGSDVIIEEGSDIIVEGGSNVIVVRGSDVIVEGGSDVIVEELATL